MKGIIIRTDSGIVAQINEQTGEPIKVSSPVEVPVKCLYSSNNLNNHGVYSEGEFQKSSFSITTKDLSFFAHRIKLLDSFGKFVCEKDVLSLELLSEVKRVKIII